MFDDWNYIEFALLAAMVSGLVIFTTANFAWAIKNPSKFDEEIARPFREGGFGGGQPMNRSKTAIVGFVGWLMFGWSLPGFFIEDYFVENKSIPDGIWIWIAVVTFGMSWSLWKIWKI